MPIPEPEGFLWSLVKPLSGWPETNEDVIRDNLAPGWRDGAAAFETAGEFNPGPLDAAWPDPAGVEYRTRVVGTTRTAGENKVPMAELATSADQLADKVGHAKEAIRTLMSSGAELVEGTGQVAVGSVAVPIGRVVVGPYLATVLATLVPRLASEVNGILDRTAASVAADLPEPGGLFPNNTEPKHEGSGKGGGQFGSDPNTLDQELTEPAYDAGAVLANPIWPDASKFLAHYLDATGTTMDVDPDQVLQDVPGLQHKVDEKLNAEIADAVKKAEADQRYGEPMQFSSRWYTDYDIEPLRDGPNWHLAIGNLNYSVAGEVIVHPPSDTGASRVEVTYQTHIADRYDFEANEPGKGVAPGGISIPGTDDAFVSKFHRAGTAQDFTTLGESMPRTEVREVP